MWGLAPWGGYGANPLPKRFERLFKQADPVTDGGYAYSEGIFEDINKILIIGFFWGATPAENILNEYISYEFESSVAKDCIELISLIEDNHAGFFESFTQNENKNGIIDMDKTQKAAKLAKRIDRTLSPTVKTRWRWRILFIRAMLDEIRYTRYEHGLVNITNGVSWNSSVSDIPEAEPYLRELMKIYHCNEINDPEKRFGHLAIRPPLKLCKSGV
jgi:hypothetical protein